MYNISLCTYLIEYVHNNLFSYLDLFHIAEANF